MKKFTKGALITSLVLAVLGFTLCAVGAGIGFHYTSIPRLVNSGMFRLDWNGWDNFWDSWDDAWDSWDDAWDSFGDTWDDFGEETDDLTDSWGSWSNRSVEAFDYSRGECADIQNLELLINVGTVRIEEVPEEQGIHIEVQYQKKDSQREIRVSQEDGTLKIEEEELSWKQINAISNNNDKVRVILQIPADMEFEKIAVENSSGDIMIARELRAKEIHVIVDAGEVEAERELQASEKLYAEVDAGEIDFAGISAKQLELVSGVGEISVERASAEEIILEGGVGELSVTLVGQEADYSYTVNCGIGEVEIGNRSYSGLGTTKEISGGSKTVDINCGIGEVDVDFTR